MIQQEHSSGCRAFLVGAERSGTTMFRLMLSHHPKLTWLKDSEYLVDYVPAPGVWPEVRAYWDILNADPALARDMRNLGVRFDPGSDYPALVDSFLERQQERDGSVLVGATVHRHFDTLVSLWPKARYIHIYRDGRDVARSRIGMGWAGNVWTASFVWTAAERLWREVRRSLDPAQVYDIQYEALVADPEKTLRDVCGFLEVEYDAAMLRYPETTTYAAPDPKLSFQWRRKLSKREIRLAESVQGDVLRGLGYEVSEPAPTEVGALEAMLLRLQCRAYRTRFRVRRLGPRLYLEDFVSRRIGSQSWRKRVAERLDENRTKHLK